MRSVCSSRLKSSRVLIDLNDQGDHSIFALHLIMKEYLKVLACMGWGRITFVSPPLNLY